VLIILLLSTSCGAAELQTRADRAPHRLDLGLDEPNGLSGLTIDDEGMGWAIPETDRVLLGLRGQGVERRLVLERLPDAVDAEAIAHLGEGRFAVGTESTDESRTSDTIFIVEVTGEVARATSRVELPYDVLTVSPSSNKGIEGICAVGETVIAAVEPKRTRDDGVCITSIARGDLRTGTWAGYEVALTTDTGKISALACRAHAEGIEVFAVERHFEVMRVLRFVVPPAPADEALTPEILIDLAGQLEGDPNIEGLAIDRQDLLMITDNHYGERTGPNELIRLRGAL